MIRENYTKDAEYSIPPHVIEDKGLRRLFESATLLPIKECILEQAFEHKTYAIDDYIDDLPVNLYGFNKCTHLLDWVLATARGTSTILDCEGMLFTKLVDLSWESLDQTTAIALSQTLSQLFQNLKCLLQKPDFKEKFRNEINAYALEMIKQTDLFDVSLTPYVQVPAASSDNRRKWLYKEMCKRYTHKREKNAAQQAYQ